MAMLSIAVYSMRYIMVVKLWLGYSAAEIATAVVLISLQTHVDGRPVLLCSTCMSLS